MFKLVALIMSFPIAGCREVLISLLRILKVSVHSCPVTRQSSQKENDPLILGIVVGQEC
jgi:hypothetical protein